MDSQAYIWAKNGSDGLDYEGKAVSGVDLVSSSNEIPAEMRLGIVSAQYLLRHALTALNNETATSANPQRLTTAKSNCNAMLGLCDCINQHFQML